MRLAVVSDIHGNRTAFEAVLADLRETSPDLILHGGDLGDHGSGPCEVVDRIRDLEWHGVLGNTDEMLFDPASLARFASLSPQFQPMWNKVAEMAAAARAELGAERLEWLRALPRVQTHGEIALMHASPDTTWRAPMDTDGDLERYRALGKPVVVYGHIHRPYIRELPGMTVANSGSVGLPHDGDRRASYLLLDDSRPSIRRVEYDVEHEIAALRASGRPYADWIARILASASPQMPED